MTGPSFERVDGFAPIGGYAALGDGRTVALVARDGSIDWLPAPAIDGPPVFGALLDAGRGGRFELAPMDEYEVERRYITGSNVLESVYETATGRASVVEGLMLEDGGQLSWIELIRRVVGLRGRVAFRYRLRPRFGFACTVPDVAQRGDVVLFSHDTDMLAFRTWDAGEPDVRHDEVEGELVVRRRQAALLTCVLSTDEPVPLPSREEHEIRLQRTIDAWQRWTSFMHYDGPYTDAVQRSALALKMLISAKTGAIAAAATTSLPERIGGDLNWDYRFAWIRDTAFTLDALGSLGFRSQVQASLGWLLLATDSTHPRLQPFYTLAGDVPRHCRDLDLEGYRSSKPVRHGNSATGQLQLGTYGSLLETIWLYVQHGNLLNANTGFRIAEVADQVCRVWRRPNSGIWELDQERVYTEALISCWLALDCALRLVEAGHINGEGANAWRSEQEAIRRFVDEHCWSERKQSYTFFAGSDELDAAVLQGARCGFLERGHPRLEPTIDAIRSELSAGGPLLWRYSGQADHEGAFFACSFWFVIALLTAGRLKEACTMMEELLLLGNDVGLYAEEIDPSSGEHLGNFPQGLTHLALINAAVAIGRARDKEEDDAQT